MTDGNSKCTNQKLQEGAVDSDGAFAYTDVEIEAEEWRDIPSYEGFYQASNLGRVKRIKPGQGARCWDVRTGQYSGKKNSYCTISLHANSRRRTFKVHRLVMLAFAGVCPSGKEVNHKNGIRNDNRLVNLEYVTPKENTRHAIATINICRLKGEDHGSAKFTEAQVIEIRSRYSAGEKQAKLAREFGVSKNSIGSIVHRKSWKHI